ncbi:helix-turn-helix domain-containing protein [Streptomyces sp. 184]|uniref:helix-turn-helix domain-containing protein n=1 Tax=Streptomyces sp. 184 TaxID=1827526 RepID=UPI0038924EC3
MPRWKELPDELDPQIREFAEHMRRLVDRSGLTVSEVADRTGYSRSSWERYLNGRLMPSRESVVAFAEVTAARDEQLMAEWGAADRAWSRAELRNESALRALRAAEPGPDLDDLPPPGGRQGRGLRGVLGRGRGRGEDVSGAGAAPRPEEIPGPARTGRTTEGPERPVRPDATERSAVRPGPPPPPERRVRAEESPGGRPTAAGAGTGTGGETGAGTKAERGTGAGRRTGTGAGAAAGTAAGAGAGTAAGAAAGKGRDAGTDADPADPARDADETTKLRALTRPTPAAASAASAPDPEPAGGTAATSRIPAASTPLTSSAPRARKSWPLRRVLLAGLVTLLLTGSGAGVVYVGHGLIADPGVEEQKEPRGGPPDSSPAGSASGSPSESESLPEGVECQGDDCTGKDPDEMGCGGDFARTTTQTYVGEMLLEIRYSEPCKAAWARITAAEPGSTVTALTEVPGEEPVREDASAGNTEGYTAMVDAAKPDSVRACAALPDGTEGCTEGTPPP